MKILIPLVLAAALAGCSVAQQSGPTQRQCDALAVMLSSRRAALEVKCAQAKDPLTDDKCMALDGINAALAACTIAVVEPVAVVAQ